MERTAGELEGDWREDVDELLTRSSAATKRADDARRWLALLNDALLLVSYVRIWTQIGFEYSFFDGLLVLSVRSCVYSFGETVLEWTTAWR